MHSTQLQLLRTTHFKNCILVYESEITLTLGYPVQNEFLERFCPRLKFSKLSTSFLLPCYNGDKYRTAKIQRHVLQKKIMFWVISDLVN